MVVDEYGPIAPEVMRFAYFFPDCSVAIATFSFGFACGLKNMKLRNPIVYNQMQRASQQSERDWKQSCFKAVIRKILNEEDTK